MKNFINFGIFIFILCNISKAQLPTSFINNSKISYVYGHVSGRMIKKNDYRLARDIVRVKLTDSQRIIIKKLNKKEWLRLLNDSISDWSANLILYDLYQKDAIIFYANKISEETWRSLFKRKDLLYWRNKLK